MKRHEVIRAKYFFWRMYGTDTSVNLHVGQTSLIKPGLIEVMGEMIEKV